MARAQLAEKPWPALSLDAVNAALTGPGSPFEIETRVIDGVAQRIWKNAPPTLRDVFLLGRAHDDKDFLVYENERVSYRGFARAACGLAHALIAEGIRPGDRVAIVMRNLPEWPVAFFAGVLAGAIVTPLNAWWTGAELEYALIDSGAKVAIVDNERLERLRDHLAACAALTRVIVSRGDEDMADPLTIRLDAVIGPASAWQTLSDRDLPDVPLAPDDEVSILYTSGTTGKPKGALATHRNSTCSLMSAAFAPCRVALRRGDPLPAPSPSDPRKTMLIAIPFFHTTGCHAFLIPSLAAGVKIVMMRKWDVETAFRLIEREKVTNTGGVPTIAWQLLENETRGRYDLSSLETLSYGGAPAASDLVGRIVATWPKSQASLGWGMTETCATFTFNVAEDYENRPDSAGPAIPVCEMKIVDDAGRALPVGAVGELWAKGPNVVRGYWKNLEATAQTFVDGWLKTGDLARLDEEGFLYVIDRKKDMLIRGGENIYCIEVENALYAHPAVMDAALVGIPHRTLGEEPGAVVTLKPGAAVDEAELRSFAAKRLAAFKVPVRVLFKHEPLVRNANGKIMKSELKKLFV